MKIIIIGCGKVGFALAEELTREEHDVTVIDASAQRLQEVAEDLDALQIVGNGS
ncbi:MAG: NAD-binding protein, partial [Oliverpabstia sp.]|nr:NAD-binding protein [Oliverpabstia sp.]